MSTQVMDKMNVATESQANHESMVNDAPRTFTDADFPVGSAASQGDLMFVRLKGMPTSIQNTIRQNTQLAEGSTQGSRHVLTAGVAWDCDKDTVSQAIAAVCKGMPKIGDAYIGPVFCTENGRAEVDHPEHGDHIFEGNMYLATVFQRSLDAEEREQRVRD